MNTVHIPPTRPSGTRARRHLMVATLVAAAALSVTGCSFSAHRTVSEAQVEQTLSDRLQEIVGQRPEAIDCPDELDGVVGTALRCALTAGHSATRRTSPSPASRASRSTSTSRSPSSRSPESPTHPTQPMKRRVR